MQIAITGASGLVGSALTQALERRGDRVIAMVRRQSDDPNQRVWKPGDTLPPETLSDIDAVVHLAGESVAGLRWTAAKKARIRDSRVLGTTTIANAVAALPSQPVTLVSASGVGYYGSRGDDLLNEQSSRGSGFLADVCGEWERATAVAADSGARVVNLRIGMVLANHGGALASMLPAFRAGVGGRIGDGRQWMSWIALDDLVRLILFAIDTPTVSGPLNATAPAPVRNVDFALTLGAVLGRPTFVPAPAFALRAALGEMADELLLASQRATPAHALAAGFRFEYPALQIALEGVLG